MDFSSWFRRSLLSNNTEKPTNPNQNLHCRDEEDLRLGVTHQLIEHVKSFTLDTFKNFPLHEEETDGATSSYGDTTQTTPTMTPVNVRKDLSEWQEQHATLVLSKVKELSQLRFKLCPRYLKERQFWRIYFTLVKSYVTEYELRAIQVEKLKTMAMENEKSSGSSAVEVEMAETKQAASLADPNDIPSEVEASNT